MRITPADEALLSLLRPPSAKAGTVPLSAVAETRTRTGPPPVNPYGRQRTITWHPAITGGLV